MNPHLAANRDLGEPSWIVNDEKIRRASVSASKDAGVHAVVVVDMHFHDDR